MHSQKIIRELDQARHARLGNTVFFHEDGSIRGIQRNNVSFEFCGQADHLCVRVRAGVLHCGLIFGLIEDHNLRLATEKTKAGENLVFLGGEFVMAQRQFLVQHCLKPLKEIDFSLDDIPWAAHTASVFFLEPLKAALNHYQVVEDELGIHSLNVAQGIDAASEMWDAGVLELPHHVQKAVHLRQLIDHHSRQTCTAGAAIQASNVGIGDLGTHDLLGVVNLTELIHPWVGHVHHESVNFHLTGGHIRGDVGTRERFIKSGFA